LSIAISSSIGLLVVSSSILRKLLVGARLKRWRSRNKCSGAWLKRSRLRVRNIQIAPSLLSEIIFFGILVI
jgi:hypothetical protein